MKIKGLLKIIAIVCPALLFAGCDVHEFPDEPLVEVDCDVTLLMNFEQELPPYRDIIYETGTSSRAGVSDLYDFRYVVNIYRSANGESFTRVPYRSLTLSRDNVDILNYETRLSLPEGYYMIMVWADYSSDGSKSDRYYSTTDFASVTLMGQHVGCDDYRDAFRGEAVARVSSESENRIEMTMTRPMAKFKFIATDFDKFITRAEDEVRSRHSDAEIPEGEGWRSLVDLEEYTVRIRYTGFMPFAYNMFTDKPSDAKTGVWFHGTISPVSETEAELGFDYVFVNGHEALVQVAVELYDVDMKLISSTPAINVPLVRSKLTTIRGEFLSAQTSGGIGIQPDFAGEFNIYVP